MKWMMAVLFFAAGCGDDKPTGPKVDTTPRSESNNYFPIDRWDAGLEEWVETTDRVNLAINWKYLSSSTTADDSTLVTGDYSVSLANTTGELVEISLTRLTFKDGFGDQIAEFDIDPDDDFDLAPNETRNRAGEFQLILEDLSVTEEIEEMDLRAAVGFRR